MPDFISIDLFSPKIIRDYDPLRFAYGLGQLCETCHKPVIFQQSITACKCHRYSHRTCLIKCLNQQNLDGEEWGYQCNVCSAKLIVFYDIQITPKCEFRIRNFIGLIISLTLTLLTLAYTFSATNATYIDILCFSLILSLLFTSIFVFLVNLIFVKKNVVDAIKSTNLELIISAFVDLDFKDQEEETQTQMIRK